MDYRQVDVHPKPVSMRTSTAVGRIRLESETVRLFRGGKTVKGDPFFHANIMAILATKQTPNIIVRAHPLGSRV